MIDYHLHTPLCHHADGEPEEYVNEAVRKGLDEIGFADHFPLDLLGFSPDAQVTMNGNELDGYIAHIKKIAESSSISVKLGVELDYLPGKSMKVAKFLKERPFDYIIGSLHFMDGWDFTHPFYIEEFEKRNIEKVYEEYFTMVWEACRSGLFDIIGHVDGIKKFGYRPSPEFVRPFYKKTADVLAETGVCLEVNTAGLDAPADEMYPHPDLIRFSLKKGVKMTTGSDAHFPDQVGRHFDEIRVRLKDIGVKTLAVFTGRSRSELSI